MIRRPPRSTQSRSSAASDVYKRQEHVREVHRERVVRLRPQGERRLRRRRAQDGVYLPESRGEVPREERTNFLGAAVVLSLIHISEPTRLGMISYAVFCLKK